MKLISAEICVNIDITVCASLSIRNCDAFWRRELVGWMVFLIEGYSDVQSYQFAFWSRTLVDAKEAFDLICSFIPDLGTLCFSSGNAQDCSNGRALLQHDHLLCRVAE